jgi:hypothetical protein
MRAFYFYIDDWLSSKKIEKMDAYEERGYLHLLLAAASEDGPPSLPDDDEELAILSKLDSQWWKPTKDRAKRIGEKTSGKKLREAWLFKPVGAYAGRIYNERIYREWEKQQISHRTQSEAGKRGNQKRWGSSGGDRVAISEQSGGDRVATVSRSVPDSPPSRETVARAYGVCANGNGSNKEKSSLQQISASFARFFERWHELTGRRQRESYASSAWEESVTSEREVAAMACLERYGLSDEVSRGVVTNPDKWIYDQAADDFKGEWQPRKQQPDRVREKRNEVLQLTKLFTAMEAK